jgi:hypothetical protein
MSGYRGRSGGNIDGNNNISAEANKMSNVAKNKRREKNGDKIARTSLFGVEQKRETR